MLSGRGYRIGRLLDRGESAEVYEAFAVGEGGFERRVAIKKLLAVAEEDEQLFAGFADEARIAGQLHHANIVGVVDFGVFDGRPFLALEWVDGADLLHAWERADSLDKRPSLQVALHLAREVAHALAYAHSAKGSDGRVLEIVHRDVSPDNVLVSYSGDVKLTDFGVAYAKKRSAATRIGSAKGKLPYMAPEQLRGDPVDGRADVFSLGCLLHFLLTGESPFDARGPIQSARLDPGIAPAAAAIIERATRLDRGLRHQDAESLINDITRALGPKATDPRGALTAWIAPLRPRERDSMPKAGLFDLELVLDASNDHGLRRYSTMAKSPRPDSATPVGDLGEPVEIDAAAMLGRNIASYRLDAILGRTPSSTVFRAFHTVLEREYALKLLSTAASKHPTSGDRFKNEARHLAKVSHPRIVAVHDFGETEEGQSYLVLELVPGQSLFRTLELEGPMPVERALRLARQIAEALAEIHRTGLVHRDLKTANVQRLPGDGDELKLLDFGISKMLGAEALTRAGQLLGTPSYMAPEQLRGEEVDGRTDLFALGVIIYELIAGRRPFKAPEQLLKVAPPLHEAPELDPLVQSLLADHASKRPPSALAVIELIDRYLAAGEPTAVVTKPMQSPVAAAVGPPPISYSPSVSIARTGSPQRLVVLALVTAVALAFLALGWWLGQPARDQAPLHIELGTAAPPPTTDRSPVVIPRPEPPPPATPLPPPPAAIKKPELPPPPAPPKPDPGEVRRTLERALGERGLTSADLIGDAATNVATALRGEGDLATALSSIRAAPIDDALLKKKLERISKALASPTLSLSQDRRVALEKRYLDLRAQLVTGLGADELEALAKAALKLELALLEG